MNNLVMGGAGFIGTNLVKKLLLEDENVISLDCFSSDNFYKKANIDQFNSHPNYVFHNFDCSDYEGLLTICRDNNIDIIYNCLGIHYDIKRENFATRRHNLFNSHEFVTQVMNVLRIKKMVYFSSIGVSDSDEVSPYLRDKKRVELLFKKAAHDFDLNIIIINAPEVYGLYLSTHHFIYKYLDHIYYGLTLPIVGNSLDKLDFLFISDLLKYADIFLKNDIAFSLRGCRNEIVGVGNYYSYEEIAKQLSLLTCKKIIIASRDHSRIPVISSEAGRNTAYLNDFYPQVDLPKGLLDLYNWYLARYFIMR